MAEERPKEVLAMLYGVGGTAGTASESGQVRSGIVGERIVLEPGPEIFGRIELGCARRWLLQVCRWGKNALIDELPPCGLRSCPR